MLDDLLRERLMDYANAGSEATRAPSPARIRRRGRHHYARLAAGTLAVVVLAAGGIAATGKVVRHLEPASHQIMPSDLVVSADRTTVWFAYGGCVPERGVFRVAVRGGAITKVIAEGADELAVSRDGRKLAYVSTGCGAQGPRGDVVVRDLASGAERRWPTSSSGGPIVQLSLQQPLAWSPDGRHLAVVVGDVDQRQQVRLVDTTRAGSLAGAPIVRVPDRGCWPARWC